MKTGSQKCADVLPVARAQGEHHCRGEGMPCRWILARPISHAQEEGAHGDDRRVVAGDCTIAPEDRSERQDEGAGCRCRWCGQGAQEPPQAHESQGAGCHVEHDEAAVWVARNHAEHAPERQVKRVVHGEPVQAIWSRKPNSSDSMAQPRATGRRVKDDDSQRDGRCPCDRGGIRINGL